MNTNESEETRSFRDPMAARLEAAQKRRESAQAQYPLSKDVYDGFYTTIKDLNAEGSRFFLGAEGIVGSELPFDGERVALVTEDGRVLMEFTEKTKERLARHVKDNWRIKVYLSATFYRSEDQSGSVELAFICWAPLADAEDAALEAFSGNIAHRLTSGDRAGLKLSQEKFIEVVRSDGAWYLTPTQKREPLPKGTVIYKNKRTFIERITGFALRHRLGCNILATVFWLALIAGIVVLVWQVFFS